MSGHYWTRNPFPNNYLCSFQWLVTAAGSRPCWRLRKIAAGRAKRSALAFVRWADGDYAVAMATESFPDRSTSTDDFQDSSDLRVFNLLFERGQDSPPTPADAFDQGN
ncbi:hypothetical protein CEXT_264881 [Caerostris extrusa]|uniref:Uncharacterized protein n=1 Tax=Caerostris extrusa TaxID=172846 RepID=A0AAV4WUL3_CAEEX|nr:hypothetical protein CEXT_264881 [Caerostris extrusa]